MKTATPTISADTVFRAFADRTRLRIMHLLLGQDELCVCDLVRVLDLPQAKVSRHLAYLRKAGLVEARREGQWMHYRLIGADSAFHKKLLECLACCFTEIPELKQDRAQLNGDDDAACGDDCC